MVDVSSDAKKLVERGFELHNIGKTSLSKNHDFSKDKSINYMDSIFTSDKNRLGQKQTKKIKRR